MFGCELFCEWSNGDEIDLRWSIVRQGKVLASLEKALWEPRVDMGVIIG
jgi:hypothetical protein